MSSDALGALVRQLKTDPSHEPSLDLLTQALLPQAKAVGIKQSLIHRLIETHPDVPGLRTVAVKLCRAVGDYEERLAQLEALEKIGARGESFLYEYARTLRDNGQFARCVALCATSLAEYPHSLDLLKLRASVYVTLGQPERALGEYERALAMKPDDHNAKTAIGFIKLQVSDCRDGYAEYAANADFEIHKRGLTVTLPQWRGENISGKKLLLWCSQGLGDVIMFSSLLPWLTTQNAKVTVALYPRMIPLFSRSFPGFIFIPHTPDMLNTKAYDYHGILDQLMASALPHYTPAAHPPFLKADPARTAALRGQYLAAAKKGAKKLVGISWHTNNKETFSQRNIPLELWQPLLELPNIQLVSLQYGNHTAGIEAINRKFPGAIHHDPAIDPLGDMEAPCTQICAMDKVVSIQNSTVHMAGALGVKTTLMLSAASDWRWGIKRTDSQWYKSVTIDRQEKLLEWKPVLARVCGRLAAE